MANKTVTFPSVLALERQIAPSDGFLYSTSWSDRNNKRYTPLKLFEKSVRGTISNRLSAKIEKDPAKIDALVSVPNLQTIDSCTLGTEDDTLRMSFTLKILSGIRYLSACNNLEFLEKYRTAVNEYISRHGFRELALRYSHNIAAGRFLWRNRVGAEEIEINVSLQASNKYSNGWVFNGKDYSLKDFDSKHADLANLSEYIGDTLSGKYEYILLDIETFVKAGRGQEVYPSEELVQKKGKKEKGGKSKTLYAVNDIAGIHSQKIGNAIRTIDTWYNTDGEKYAGPIAVEPYGSVTSLGKAFRPPASKIDFYTLFEKFISDIDNLAVDELHYVMAVLVRGGVFGESSKED